MTIKFNCPNGHPMYANSSQIGKTFACRKCGQTAIVPDFSKDPETPSTKSDFAIEPKMIPKTPVFGVQGSIPSDKSRTGLPRFARYGILVCACLMFSLGSFFVYKWMFGEPYEDTVTGFRDRQASDISSQLALRTQEVASKLRAIGTAWVDYESKTRRLLPSNDTKLSWRVHLLPYLGYGTLYHRFRLNESWDSPINSELIAYMPETYRLTGNASRGHTRIQVAVGKHMIFGSELNPSFSSVTDGVDDTLLAVVVSEDLSTPWTKPDTLDIKPDEPIRSLGNLKEDFICAIACTGDPVFFPKNSSPLDFYATLTPRGGEAVEISKLILAMESNSKDPAPKLSEKKDPSETNWVPPELTKAIDLRKEKLKKVGAALLNFESAHKCYPVSLGSPGNFDEANRPNLSWRVHLLKELGQRNLFEKFNFYEPWDSPHNLQLLKLMPDVYRDPMSNPGSTTTRIVRLTGPNALFSDVGPGPKKSKISDHPAETLLIVLAGAEKAVPWTKPEDLPYDGKAPVRRLGRMDMPMILGLFADNAIAVFDPNIPTDIFNAYVTPRGNEPLGSDPYVYR